jgi:hypothetical protein
MTENQVHSKYFNFRRNRIIPRNPNALILASLVSGFTWYFTNQQANNFNSHQQELIGRVERGEESENCKSMLMQSKLISTASK